MFILVRSVSIVEVRSGERWDPGLRDGEGRERVGRFEKSRTQVRSTEMRDEYCYWE